MKKFALGLLSVFMILGGVLLSACEKKVSLSVSLEEVVIFTNDEQEENYKQKDIDITISNSTAGANVEILKGQDSVRVSSVRHKSGDVYSFTIFGDKSGEAEVKVSAVEDNKQSKIINVKVNTILEELKSLQDDSTDARTNLYAVKGVEKYLNVGDYFNLQPTTANVSDIVWSFEETQNQECIKDDILVAKIENNKLLILNEFSAPNVVLRASFVRNMSVYNTVKFEVLENSTINSLVVDAKTLYQNNTVATRNATFELKRNDANKSSVEGTIVVNSPYNINLDTIVYERKPNGTKESMSRNEYEKYFTFEVTQKTIGLDNKITYTFVIDALDKQVVNLFGQFYFYLKVGYQDYNFDITTEAVDVLIDTSYSATKIELSNQANDSINNSIIDVFSNYETGNGFQIKTLVLPEDVVIDNSMFFVSVDLNQPNLKNLTLPGNDPVSSFVNFYSRGEILTFTPVAEGSSVYISTNIANATDLYVSSANEFDVLEGIDFKFVSVSNANANTTLTMNFYKTSTEKTLTITDAAGEDLQDVYFLSSNILSSRKMNFSVKIQGISTISGLQLKNKGNSKFQYSDFQLVESNFGGDEGNYVIVDFTVSLNGYNFDDISNFWFEHITGKKSKEISINVFVPLLSASVENADKASADVYKEELSTQNFVEKTGTIELDNSISTNSLSKLMLEAGTSLPLSTNYQNASLGEKGVSYKFLSFDDLKSAIRIVDGLNDEAEIAQRAETIFAENSLSTIAASYYRYFEAINGTFFTISQDMLKLNDNEFRGFVCVLFDGFNQNHESVTAVRFFALESFYSVKYLSSNVQTTLLYTTETLSINDMNRARVDVSISLRPDEKIPTYSNNLSCFTFSSTETLVNEGSLLSNRYYTISDVSFSSSGKYFNFRITANSTNMQTFVRDVLRITYTDANGFTRQAEIQIEIKNVKRIENVKWLNQTADNEIYLNLTTTVSSERSFTISTSVLPSDANDIGLSYAYFATAGSAGDLSITTSSIGQTFNLNINTNVGGYGSLFLLPNDMIKYADGVRQLLVYKYTENQNGDIVETPIYIKMTDLNDYYDEIINGSNDISNYFYNNDREKVFYKDIIIKINITIADGSSEGTAIRIYNEADLKSIDFAKYYKIMNNITLNNWTAYRQFNGMIFGKDNTITLRFEAGSQNFVNELNGTLKNLIFAGQVSNQSTDYAGFVVNKNNGTLDNVSIDVYYSNGEYKSSVLNATATTSVGGLVGLNNGTVKNSYSYGVTIDAVNANSTGGLVGSNAGTIIGSGVEFYLFAQKDENGKNISNTIKAGTTVGGIVGLAEGTSKIDKSYVYAYSLAGDTIEEYNISNIITNEGSTTLGVFMGKHAEGASVNESFGFMGSLKAPVNSPTNTTYTHFTNSYLTYKESSQTKLQIFRDVNFSYDTRYTSGAFSDFDLLTDNDIPTNYQDSNTFNTRWKNLVANLNHDIWETENIDKNSNFGFVYLKNVSQSADVEIGNIKIADVKSPLKVLNAGTDAVSGKEKGIMFVYKTKTTVTEPAAITALTNYNTISIADMFGITQKQARSLLITSDSKDIAISTNSIKVLNKNTTKFELSVHLKMNFTESKTFEFVILNFLPELSTTIDSVELKDGQKVLLQTGLDASRTVMFNMKNTIYLNGVAYQTEKDNYSVEYSTQNNTSVETGAEHLSISKSTNYIVMRGQTSHSGDAVTNVEGYIVVDDISFDSGFVGAIKEQRKRNFDVFVYNGATALVVNNASNLVVNPSQFAVFDVLMTTDNADDDLIFGMTYGEVEIENISLNNNTASFDFKDGKLILDLSWTKNKSSDGTQDVYKVLIKINNNIKHLVTKDYENIVISVNAKSQANNTKYVKNVGLTVKTQDVEDINITTYSIGNRQIRDSVLYITPSNEIINSISPSMDAIVSVVLSPAYAKMTHFTLTYSNSSSADGNLGTASLSKLNYRSIYGGFYVNPESTQLITNGIRVNLTEEDKKGNGVFYFRLYVSSTYKVNSDLKLTLTCFYENDSLISGNHNLNVTFMPEASIKVNGVSTYVISKGSTATVTVTVNADQKLYDLYLQNNKANITLSSYEITEEYETYKVYTALLSANIDALLDNGKSSGIFYVCAAVERIVNNVQEIKISRATLCLVDFSVDANGISVKASGNTSTYNGKTYDAFISYVGSTDELNFNYPILPESYNYDKNNASEEEAYNKIMASRSLFEKNNYYKDDDVGYYINHKYNENNGYYEPLTLKEQLWYATDESVSSAIYNGTSINQKDIFNIDESENSGSSRLMVRGIRTGRQLMKLQTTVLYQGIEFVYDYYFLIVVDIWSDENTPTQIDSGEKFVDFATKSEKPDDYILMSDIVLNDYSPVNTDLIKSLDGNGFTIHINSFAMPEGNILDLALFSTIDENTTLKNITVNIYNGGQITVDISQYKTINIAGFALENNGVVYNCQVISYYDSNYQSFTLPKDNGLMVEYVMGVGTDPIEITASMNIESNISGFVGTNNASIMNSRVGGESFSHIIDVGGIKYVKTQNLDTFVLKGQGNVAGFINTNSSSGYLSASFANCIQIYNDMASPTSLTAGFALYNSNNIQNSYVEGVSDKTNILKPTYMSNLTNITSQGIIGGFVYQNSGLVKNSYSNIGIENSKSKASMVAGFVYRNEAEAEITLCYSACSITKTDINQMQFSGVDEISNSLNFGTISFSYFRNDSRIDDTTQSKVTNGALSVSDVSNQDTFYGFSFSSAEDEYDGIWKMTPFGISLVSANKIAMSNRYAVTNGNLTSIFYNKNIVDIDTYKTVDLSYGSSNNPIIIRNAYDFAVATGKATTKEISAYKEYYNDREVFGNYRIVNNIDMAEIDQNSENENSVKLTTTTKTFKGLLDGNGFIISNINLGSSVVCENYGLYARLENAVVMNLDLIVDSIHNSQANIVGTLAGTAVDTRILAINLTPVQNQETVSNTSILGNNIVGGVVGMLFGDSCLNDIHIKDIDIYSSYYKESKTISSNSKFTGTSMREYVEYGNSLQSKVRELSYAGAIVGYVDIYQDLLSEYVQYYSNLNVSDFDIVTVHVSDAVNIYGEVSGGLFGYVGNSTMIYDASIQLAADMNLSHPSYIISKNLYSGGLIGENYGGLFAVFASYSSDLQSTIEKNENSYYNGDLNVERGQMSIFNYTPNDLGYISNIDDPMFIGGLVGYMGGGYIYTGYNKLNVISYSSKTLAVGGIIGLAGYTSTQYDLMAINGSPKVNIFLNEVYASGDVRIEKFGPEIDSKKSVAGIIGGIEKNKETTIIAMRYVAAVNYYSNTGVDLSGVEHYMLVGKVYDTEDGFKIIEKLNTNLYLVNSDNNTFNVRDKFQIGGTGRNGVGGYNFVELGTEPGVGVTIKPYGFNVDWFKDTDDLDLIYSNILKFESIGEADMDSTSVSYAKMYNYFLPNGWNDEYWVHTENTLFPHIELLPKLNVVFWDYYNTPNVLKMMNNSALTIVLRGKMYQDDSNREYADIDLTDTRTTQGSWEPITGFRGKLISYYEYINSDSEGKITNGREIVKDGKIVGGYVKENDPNKEGDRVGIILDKPLFESIDSSVTIEGINFYFYTNVGNSESSNQEKSDFGIVNGIIRESIFRNVRIVINQNKYLNTKETQTISGGGNKDYCAGLISSHSVSTSFINIDVIFRNQSQLYIKHEETTVKEDSKVYMGVLVGILEHSASSVQVSIENINVVQEKKEENNNSKLNINFQINKSRVGYFYAGIYAGYVAKIGSSKISLGLSTISNVNLNIEEIVDDSEPPTENEFYVGGYVGAVKGVDNVTLSGKELSGDSQGISINQNCNIDKFFVGLGFGYVENSSLQIVNDGFNQLAMVGGIYQIGSSTTNKINLGGFVGKVNSAAEIQGFVIDLTVANATVSSEEFVYPDYSTGGDKTLFDENIYDYKTGLSISKEGEGGTPTSQDVKLSPYKILGDEDDSFGGIFGYVTGSKVKVIGSCNISGTIDVDIAGAIQNRAEEPERKVSIGGMVGKTFGSIETNILSNNTMNISVSESNGGGKNTAYVGGVVGNVAAASTVDTNSIENIKINYGSPDKSRVVYTGTVLSSVNSLKFGGAIGFVGRQDYTNNDKSIIINNVVYGGAVKVYGKNIEEGKVSVGGVVGEFALTGTVNLTETKYTVSNCFTYGDVFINYNVYREDEDLFGETTKSGYVNDKLNEYNFGGIVGSNSYVNIKDCISMMTSFNDRLPDEIANYHVGAISGKNSDLVNNASKTFYNDNFYSSGVCMAYQVEDGNIDIAYGRGNNSSPYSGYTNKVVQEQPEEGKEVESYSSDDILAKAGNIVADTTSLPEGHKLNPFKWNNSYQNKMIKDEVGGTLQDEYVSILGSYHNIKWVTLTENMIGENSIQNPIADNFTNIAFIGNGHSIERDDEETIEVESSTSLGGIVNTMGADYNTGYYDEESGKDTNLVNFSVISGLLVDLNVTGANIDLKSGTSTSFYGGVAGSAYGHSFIYGTGVSGELSVGGKNQQLSLGGISGKFVSGMINECYVDADITYRAAEEGVVSGIANLRDKNTTIKATYSSGLILTYIDINVYTFAKSTSKTEDLNKDMITSNDVVDIYSISQISRNNIFGKDTLTGQNYFLSGFIVGNSDGEINVIQNALHGCYDIPKYAEGTSNGQTKPEHINITNYQEIGDLSLQYSNVLKRGWNSIYVPGESNTPTDTSYSTWYFSRLTNYGYAAHGFGYLKNVTTYTRTEEVTEEVTGVPIYNYTPVAYLDLLNATNEAKFGLVTSSGSVESPWYLGVPNAGKFQQMFETIRTKDTNGNVNSLYTKDFKFVLRYGFDMSTFDKDIIGINIGKSEQKNGVEKFNLEIDGNNKTLDFSFTEELGSDGETKALGKGLFGTVIGNISNLTVNSLNVKNTELSNVGLLANEVTGNLTNISIVGNLTNSKTGNIGGVVGKLDGNAEYIDAVVNIENTGSGSAVGGVVGFLVKKPTVNTIDFSSNSGMIISNVEDSSTAVKKADGTTDITASIETKNSKTGQATVIGEKNEENNYVNGKINSVVGGIVGFVEEGRVANSYNANSVLANYIRGNATNIAGGIVGYADKTEIENCHNTGLVGAGNTAVTNYSFAGGIFGYGNGPSVKSCINDASVEAIGELPDANNYKIKKETSSTSEKMNEYQNIVSDLSYKITMIYNYEENRKVYSYGLGYIGKIKVEGAQGISSSSSSTNNIKNYGNFGEVSYESYLIFERTKILDNGNAENDSVYNNGKVDFYGKFDSDGKIYVNGYDAFGMPAHIYMKDNISRIYGDPNSENDIQTTASYTIPDADKWLKGKERYDAVYAYENGKWKRDTSSSFDYSLEASTDYYSSLSFPRYETILNDKNDLYFGLVGYDCTKTGTETGTETGKNILENEFEFEEDDNVIDQSLKKKKTVESKIEEIEKKKDNENGVLKSITINGETASIVNSSSNFKTVFAPFSYTLDASFPIAENNIDTSLITNKDFKISNVILTDDNGKIKKIVPQYTEVNFNIGVNSVDVKYTIFLSEAVAGATISANLTYTSNQGSINLGKNNVIKSSSNDLIYIVLKDTKNQFIVNEETINSIEIGETVFEVKLNGENGDLIGNDNENNETCVFKIDKDGSVTGFENVVYIEYSGNKNLGDFSNKDLYIYLIKKEKGYLYSETPISIESKKVATIDVNNNSPTTNARFTKMVQKKRMTNLQTVSIEKIMNNTFVYGKKIKLSSLLDEMKNVYSLFELTKVSFGNNNYSIYFDNNTWKVDKQNSNDGIDISIVLENGEPYLIIKKAISQNGVDVEIQESEVSSDYESDINYFIDNIFKNFDVYHKRLGSISCDNNLNSTQDNNINAYSNGQIDENFVLLRTYKIKSPDSNNFDVSGLYKGNDLDAFAGEDESVAESKGISWSTQNYFGLDFKTIILVEYKYELETSKIIVNDSSIGYDIELYRDSSLQYFIQGVADGSDASNIDMQGIIDKDEIRITYLKTKVILEEGEKVRIIGNELSLKIDQELDVETTYVVSKGKETDPYTGNGQIDFIRTEKNYTQSKAAQTNYTYIYTIYANGTISVEYKYSNIDGTIPQDKLNACIKYIVNKSNMNTEKGMKVAKLNLVQATDENGNPIYDVKLDADGKPVYDEQGNLQYDTNKPVYNQVWKIDDNLSMKFDRIYFDKREKVGSLPSDEKDIIIDLIAGSLNDDGVFFIRNDTEFTFLINSEKETIKERPTNYNYNLYSTQKSDFSPKGDHSMIDGTLEYKTQINGEWIKESSDIITADKIGSYTYYYRFKNEISIGYTLGNGEKLGNVSSIMILNDNVRLGQTNFNKNEISIMGNGHFIRFITNKTDTISLFLNNENNLQNLNIIGITSMESAMAATIATDDEPSKPLNYSMLSVNNGKSLTENLPMIKNIKIYGNIRNINPTIDREVKPIIYTNIGNDKDDKDQPLNLISNIKSYISITGLKGNKNDNVKPTLTDELTVGESKITNVSTYLSKNILISGDGAHGLPGEDGVYNSRSGKSGTKGYNGGSIKIQVETFQGIARTGSAGVGGYGGNGYHGYYDKISEQSLGGGAAGSEGKNGDVVELEEMKDEETVTNKFTKLNNLTPIDVATKNNGKGNAGIGGFGRIICDNSDKKEYTFCTSGGGGGLGGEGSPGITIKNWRQNAGSDENPQIYYGLTKDMSVIKDNEHMALANDWWRGVKWEVDSVIEKSTQSFTSGTGGDGISGIENSAGTNTTANKLYLSIQVTTYRHGFLAAWMDVYSWSKISWLSGEIINSSGSCAISNSAKEISNANILNQ